MKPNDKFYELMQMKHKYKLLKELKSNQIQILKSEIEILDTIDRDIESILETNGYKHVSEDFIKEEEKENKKEDN